MSDSDNDSANLSLKDVQEKKTKIKSQNNRHIKDEKILIDDTELKIEEKEFVVEFRPKL